MRTVYNTIHTSFFKSNNWRLTCLPCFHQLRFLTGLTMSAQIIAAEVSAKLICWLQMQHHFFSSLRVPLDFAQHHLLVFQQKIYMICLFRAIIEISVILHNLMLTNVSISFSSGFFPSSHYSVGFWYDGIQLAIYWIDYIILYYFFMGFCIVVDYGRV